MEIPQTGIIRTGLRATNGTPARLYLTTGLSYNTCSVVGITEGALNQAYNLQISSGIDDTSNQPLTFANEDLRQSINSNSKLYGSYYWGSQAFQTADETGVWVCLYALKKQPVSLGLWLYFT